MTLNLHRQPKLPFRAAVIAAGVIVVAALLIWLIPNVRGTAHSAILPLWRAGIAGGALLDKVGAFFHTRSSLDREIATLREELLRLRFEALEAPMLREENRRLSELWQRRSYEESVLGRVLARPSASPYDTFVLDVGQRNSVSEGDLVIADGIAIGVIAHVFWHTSVAKLFSAPGVVSVVSIDETSTPIEAQGRGAGNFIAKVPRNIDVVEGSVVMLPDFNPRVFAVVERVAAEASDPFRTIYFRLPINFSEIDFVEVVVEGSRPLPTEIELPDEHEITSP